MNKLTKILIIFTMLCATAVACISCQNNTVNPPSGGESVSDEFTDAANSYRIRFVYSYTAKVENSSGRLENKKSIVTVQSFYVSKETPVITDALLTDMKALSYHGFTFDKWYSEWNFEEQKGVEGKEFSFSGSTITDDITIFCDRGNLAGENVTWELALNSSSEEAEAYTLKLDGSGATFDFRNANEVDIPWYKYADKITKVEVSNGISAIGNNIFKGLSKVKEVVLPDSIVRIGASAFEGYGATSFVAPTSLKVIEKNAFSDTSLKEVVLNEGLEVLGERAFYGSNKIKTIVFPSTIKEINVATFHPGSVNSKNNKHSLSKVYYLGNEDQFNSMTIGMDNTWFEDKATIYYYRASLADGDVGTYWHYDEENGTTAIQYFYTLRYIQGSAKSFLCNIYVPVDPTYDENGNIVRDEEGLPLLKGVITEDHLVQQSNITYNNYQFSGFSGSDALKLGMEITSDLVYTCQRGNILSSDGGIKWAFSGDKLTIYIDGETESRIIKDLDSRIKDRKLVLTDLEKDILGTDHYQIDVTDSVKAQIISGRLERSLYMWDFFESYDASAIWTANTKTIVIDAGIKYIGKYAFAGIARTAQILIPSTVENIHPMAFEGCTDLISLYYDGTAPESVLALSNGRFTVYSKAEKATAALGNYWMDIRKGGVISRVAWTLSIDGTLTIGGDSKMINFSSASEAPWYGAKDMVTSVKFADNLTSIGEYAVNGYTNATKLYIGRNTRKIPASALDGMGILYDYDAYVNNLLVVNGHLIKVSPIGLDINMVETNTTIVTIAEGAFSTVSNISSLFIARTVQHIDEKAFDGCQIDYVFADGDKDFWSTINNGSLTSATKVYFKHTDKLITITDDNGKQVTVNTSSIPDTYWFKSGNEYVVWGEPSN